MGGSLVETLDRRAPAGVTLALLAAGPLLKLTAFPVVVFAVVAIWKEGRRHLAVRGGILALAVFPVQALRGWNWGGTLEFNQAAAAAFSVSDAAVGLVRSVYTFWKTTFWLGEWSFFRAPRRLVGAYLLLWIAALVLARRRPIRGESRRTAWPRSRPPAASWRSLSETVSTTATGAASADGTRGRGCRGWPWRALTSRRWNAAPALAS